MRGGGSSTLLPPPPDPAAGLASRPIAVAAYVHVALAVRAQFLAAHRVRDVLRVLHRALADVYLLGDHRPLFDIDLLLAHRHADVFPFADGAAGSAAVDRAALDNYLLARHG